MTPSTETAVHVACASLLAMQATEITGLSWAPKTSVCRVRLACRKTVIIKLFTGSAQIRAARERRAIGWMGARSWLRPPGVLGYGPVPACPVTALIMEDLGEVTLARAVTAGAYSSSDAIELLGRVLADFHRLPAAPGRPIDMGYE